MAKTAALKLRKNIVQLTLDDAPVVIEKPYSLTLIVDQRRGLVGEPRASAHFRFTYSLHVLVHVLASRARFTCSFTYA
jgi:hypothetical protein